MLKKKKEGNNTWSIDMLKEFRGDLLNAPVPEVNFVLKEKVSWISLEKASEMYRCYFLGESARFDGVYFGLSSHDSSTEECQGYMGYIEILNGISEDGEPVPMIRGFIKKDITFFESVGKMAIESRILHSNNLLVLSIWVNVSGLKDTPAENMLNLKIPIESVKVSHRVSFV